MKPLLARLTLVGLVALAAGCARPFLGPDGKLTFPEEGGHGAAIVTADGLQFRDRADVPARIVNRDPSEPWRAPIGFILPRSGRFTRASSPTVVALPWCGTPCGEPDDAASGLGIVLRPSDTRVPSWGGEVLVRIDVIAPAAPGTARFGENVALVIDGDGADTLELADVALGQLAARDRVAVIDTSGASVIVPAMPASHRSMARAAIAKRLGSRSGVPNLAAALRLSRSIVSTGSSPRRVLLLTDGRAEHATAELEELRANRTDVTVVGTSADDAAAFSSRANAVREAIPSAGLIGYRDVRLTFEGTPAPSHVLEASGGDVQWGLDSGELVIGDVHAGEARTEVVRVTVPAWVPGEKFAFTVTAHVDDVKLGQKRELVVTLPCVYDDDLERIANSRHGDVIAYASALATLKRLDAAFVGEGITRSGGLRRIATMHANSMALFARDTKDFASLEQAEILKALLSVSIP